MPYSVKSTQIPSNPLTYKLVLLDDCNEPIGYATGEFRQYAMWYDGQRHFFITDFVLTDRPQQPGLGARFLKAVESFAYQQGACWIRGQLERKPNAYADLGTGGRDLSTFWGASGYGLKQEIYDDSIRVWKALRH
ncbi:hypothetical protein [Spirosoma koreense]